MMKSKTPLQANTPTSNDRAIEAFFAHLGLDVEVVDRCPIEHCEECRTMLSRAA